MEARIRGRKNKERLYIYIYIQNGEELEYEIFIL